MRAAFLVLLPSSADSPNTCEYSTPLQVPHRYTLKPGHAPRDSTVDLGSPAGLPGLPLNKLFDLVLEVFPSEVKRFLQIGISFSTNRGDEVVGRMIGCLFLIVVV